MGIKSSLAKALWREIKNAFRENVPQFSSSPKPPYSAPLPISNPSHRSHQSHRSAPPKPSTPAAPRTRVPSSRTRKPPTVSQPPPPPSSGNRYSQPLPENFDYSRDIERMLNALLLECEEEQEKSAAANIAKQNAEMPRTDLAGEIQRPQVTFNAPQRSNRSLKVCRDLPSLEPSRPRQQQRRSQNYADYFIAESSKPSRPESSPASPRLNQPPKRSSSRRIIPSPATSPLTPQQICEAFTALGRLFGTEIPYAVTGSAAQHYHTSRMSMSQRSALNPSVQSHEPVCMKSDYPHPLPDHITLLCPSSSTHALRAWALARGAVSLPNRSSFAMHLPTGKGQTELRKVNIRAVADVEWEALIAESYIGQNGAKIILSAQLR